MLETKTLQQADKLLARPTEDSRRILKDHKYQYEQRMKDYKKATSNMQYFKNKELKKLQSKKVSVMLDRWKEHIPDKRKKELAKMELQLHEKHVAMEMVPS